MSEEVLRFVHRKKKLKNRFSVSIGFNFLHSREPAFIYHLVGGVRKFLGIPRFLGGSGGGSVVGRR